MPKALALPEEPTSIQGGIHIATCKLLHHISTFSPRPPKVTRAWCKRFNGCRLARVARRTAPCNKRRSADRRQRAGASQHYRQQRSGFVVTAVAPEPGERSRATLRHGQRSDRRKARRLFWSCFASAGGRCVPHHRKPVATTFRGSGVDAAEWRGNTLAAGA